MSWYTGTSVCKGDSLGTQKMQDLFENASNLQHGGLLQWLSWHDDIGPSNRLTSRHHLSTHSPKLKIAAAVSNRRTMRFGSTAKVLQLLRITHFQSADRA